MADRYEEKAREIRKRYFLLISLGALTKREGDLREACALAEKAIAAALREQDAWWPIETAPKDGTRILVVLKNPIPRDRADLRNWDGIPFVARHQGLADDAFDFGWSFAAPVGHGGFPDEWIAGWRPLPAPPPDTGRGQIPSHETGGGDG